MKDLSSEAVCVEMLEIGPYCSNESSRNCLFGSAQAVVLVHDLSNRKSWDNLWTWAAECSSKISWKYEKGESKKFEVDLRVSIPENGSRIPFLVVGNKLDLVNPAIIVNRRDNSLLEEYRATEINISALSLDFGETLETAIHELIGLTFLSTRKGVIRRRI